MAVHAPATVDRARVAAVAGHGLVVARPAGLALAAALLLSTQFLAQPFVWRNWPWDEIALAWLDIAAARLLVVAPIVAAVVATGALASRAPRWRWPLRALAVVAGATLGEFAVALADLDSGVQNAADAAVHVARWSVLAGSALAVAQLWRRADAERAALSEIELRRTQLERRHAVASADLLRSQIEPHFLFNTLATVRRLREVEPDEGARLLGHFVAYLRSSQSDPGDRSTLGREIELAGAYLGILEHRLHGRLTVRVSLDPALASEPFPRLVVATLVENAVKHGIEPAIEGGRIDVKARVDGDTLEVTVADTGVGLGGKTGGSGIGLSNIRARLDIAHGPYGTLRLAPNAPRGVRAIVRVPRTGGEARVR